MLLHIKLAHFFINVDGLRQFHQNKNGLWKNWTPNTRSTSFSRSRISKHSHSRINRENKTNHRLRLLTLTQISNEWDSKVNTKTIKKNKLKNRSGLLNDKRYYHGIETKTIYLPITDAKSQLHSNFHQIIDGCCTSIWTVQCNNSENCTFIRSWSDRKMDIQ